MNRLLEKLGLNPLLSNDESTTYYCVLKEEGTGGRKMGDMTYSEIGSYFWLDDRINESQSFDFTWLPKVDDSSFTFSGRNNRLC